MGTSTLIVLAVIVVAALWVISIYNGLVSMRQRVNQAFADRMFPGVDPVE